MSYDLTDRLLELKELRNAIMLVHNYQRPELQDVADFLGDSLGLARKASETDAEVILFCGVNFMAETASIICPDRKVLVPDKNAGCPMAAMITPKQLLKMKAGHPDALVVCYVNSTAEIKAISDVCCTSANAVRVVASLPAGREIIFVPDSSLGHYTAVQTGRELILWPGYCPTHHRIIPESIIELKGEHPEAFVMLHPECTHDVIQIADLVASTGGMVSAAAERDAGEFIVGTEQGLVYRLRKENPEKKFYHATPMADCPNMKLNTLEKSVWALEDMVYEVKIEEPTASMARRAIERMLDVS